MLSRSKFLLPLLVFFIPLSIYFYSSYLDYSKDYKEATFRKVLPSYDVVSNTFLPFLLLKYKTFDFNPIYSSIKIFDDATKDLPYFLVRNGKHLYSSYPIITGLIALPFYAPFVLLNKIPELTYAENILKVALLGRIVASIMAATSVLIFYETIKIESKSVLRTLIFTLFYALGTSTFSVSSRGLWLHTTSQLLYSIILLLLLKKEKSSNHFGLLGFLLGLTVLNRLTNVIFALVLFLYILFYFREPIKFFLLGVLPTVIYFLSYNLVFFGSPFVEGYAARGASKEWTGNFVESIPAMFISPARGFLFISPLLLLGFISMYIAFKKKNSLNIALSLGFLFSMLLIGKWYAWHGVNVFGNRMLADFLPFIGYLSFLVFDKLKKLFFILALVAGIYSIYIHTNAVFLRNARCSVENNWTFKCLQWGGK
jgi:hypothetical protein